VIEDIFPEPPGWLHILDLVKLEKHHVESLLRRYIAEDIRVIGEFFLSWDGNLRSVMEWRYSVSIAHCPQNPKALAGPIVALTAQLQNHIKELSQTNKLILAMYLHMAKLFQLQFW